MTVAQLQAGFLKLGETLYSDNETAERRRNFKARLKTSPNFMRGLKEKRLAFAA